MAQASTLQVTLPKESIEFVQGKVASGKFASESEVILEGIAACEVAVPAYERLLADPSCSTPVDQVRRNFAVPQARGTGE